jgi:hypothetical protein
MTFHLPFTSRYSWMSFILWGLHSFASQCSPPELILGWDVSHRSLGSAIPRISRACRGSIDHPHLEMTAQNTLSPKLWTRCWSFVDVPADRRDLFALSVVCRSFRE